jgi:glycosyltransferase involved in cell wall biosynthesis
MNNLIELSMKGHKKPHKILHVIAGLGDGGAEGVLARLCLHSKQLQHVVVSLTDKGKYGNILSEAGVPVYYLNMKPGELSLLKFFKLTRLIKAEQPSVVQTWMYHADLLGGVAARLAGVRRVFWGVRMSNLERGKSKRSTILIARFCALLSNFLPEKIICCANKALTVHADIGYAPLKLLVIPNGYDLTLFKPNVAAGANVRSQVDLAIDEFVVGMVGRFDPLKDHFNLLQALALVAQKQISFKCLLIGKDLSPENDMLVSKAAELGLRESVVLAGQSTDIPAVMNALDLHVLSSCSEGFPNVIAEAMACGTPCVSTDVGDALEIIGDTQLCCPARDPRALAELIAKMVDEYEQKPNVWQARKAASVQRITENFSVQAMVNAYEACWFR